MFDYWQRGMKVANQQLLNRGIILDCPNELSITIKVLKSGKGRQKRKVKKRSDNEVNS